MNHMDYVDIAAAAGGALAVIAFGANAIRESIRRSIERQAEKLAAERLSVTTTTFNQAKNAMVEQGTYYRPIETCPKGVTVWLLGRDNVSYKGQLLRNDNFAKGWFPMPNIPEEMK